MKVQNGCAVFYGKAKKKRTNRGQKREKEKKSLEHKTTRGGAYAIYCKENKSKLLKADLDLTKAQAEFEICQKENRAPDPMLSADWEKYGGQAFAFEIMETVERQPEEAQVAYAQRIETLKQWMDMQAFGCC